jgi:tripartite-type tricarboxylate transporter receptor subunit TctC
MNVTAGKNNCDAAIRRAARLQYRQRSIIAAMVPKLSLASTLSVVLACAASTAVAQAWPSRPVRLVVPFAPGGSTDVLARVLGQKLGDRLSQPFLVDNRAGAGGTIGTAIAARSNNDGYTLVLGTTSTLAINESLYPKLDYNIARDLAPIVLLAKGPFVLMATPGLPVTSLKELIAYARSRPGKLSIASSGNGTSVHLSAELFKMVAQLPDIVHIPFKGGGPAGVALMAGEVQLMINDLPPAIGPIRAGKLRALAVADSRRSPLLPEVPTFAEAGLPGYESLSWFGLLAPAGTPGPIIASLNSTTGTILATDRELRNRFSDLGVEPIGGTPAQLAAFAREETRKWSAVVKRANVSLAGGS